MHSWKQTLALVVGLGALHLLSATAAEGNDSSLWITSWNAYSKQFIDPPVFRVLPLVGTAQYRAVVSQKGRTWSVSSWSPTLSLAKIWPRLDTSKFSLTLECVAADGRVVRTETGIRVKAPDFEGLKEPSAGWAAAADRNIAYLINANEHASVPYREAGVPVWIWAATPSHSASYPCITINNLTWAFLAHVENHGPQSSEALRLARAGADWALEHRQPDSGALPLFPYSTVSMGKFGGGVEGDSVNLLRASWLAISFVDLYAVTRHEPYLACIVHRVS